MMVELNAKKHFLTWLMHHVSFTRREVIWILDYLYNHEAILKNVHFVEQAEKTQRGLVLRSSSLGEESLALFINGRKFVDSEQIFHEIRFNWQKSLYVECLFDNPWDYEAYLAVLEDNPFAPWNQQIDAALIQQIEAYFEAEGRIQMKANLYDLINQALDRGNQAAFVELTNQLNHIVVEERLNGIL